MSKDYNLYLEALKHTTQQQKDYFLMLYLKNGKTDKMILPIIKLSKHVNQYEKNSLFTPLHFAARDGRIAIVRALVEKGANINAETAARMTPLALAASCGKENIVKYLVKNKAEINYSDISGINPKLHALINGYYEIGNYLGIEGKKQLN